MYCDLPLEQHYVIKEKSHSSLFSITFNLFLCSESYFHHFSITFKLFLCSYSYSFHFIISSVCLESFHQEFQYSNWVLTSCRVPQRYSALDFPPHQRLLDCVPPVLTLLSCRVPQRYSALVFPPHQRQILLYLVFIL